MDRLAASPLWADATEPAPVESEQEQNLAEQRSAGPSLLLVFQELNVLNPSRSAIDAVGF